MNYHKLIKYDIANGLGIRVTLFVSGCTHHCEGCHNPQTWDINSGEEFTDDTLNTIIEALSPDYIRGLTLSGGDPLHPANRSAILSLVMTIKSIYPDKDIWLWTGYLYENMKSLLIFNYIDVLVDGPFLLDQRDITLKYRGSPNQRVIDIKKSLDSDSIVLYEGVE